MSRFECTRRTPTRPGTGRQSDHESQAAIKRLGRQFDADVDGVGPE